MYKFQVQVFQIIKLQTQKMINIFYNPDEVYQITP